MAIEGPLRELALTDVIQLLHLSRKTGTLSISADGGVRPGMIHFDHGFVVGARSAGEGSRLGRLLVMAGKATVGQVSAAMELQQRAPDRRIGEILAEAQGVAADEVKRQLRFQIEETIFELVRWRDGYFRFEETPALDPGRIAIRVPTESLLMEAMRRADEWSEMASGEPDASLVPVLVDRQADPAAVLSLQPREWQVLAAVDGAHTMRDIAREIGRGEFDVAKAVYSLASGGVVELRTRPTAAQAARHAERSIADESARIEKELRSGRIAEARRRVDALGERHPTTGSVSLLRGRVLERAGLTREALEAFDAAVRQDPLLSAAYFHLGLAAARLGDFRRARESLATYARLPDATPREAERALRAAKLTAELSSILEEER
jgi:tetratricopeptide (TPR) repeat protein